MNPQRIFTEQFDAYFVGVDTLMLGMAVCVFALLCAAGYACFLAIERFREWNHSDDERRARELLLLAAERARLERAFELSQSARRG